ncbi:hypothetical protein PtB15_10B370 [Puccinia triticina]|nr:hypothetical protein PtB15_10B370 [Puccinia triticina]
MVVSCFEAEEELFILSHTSAFLDLSEQAKLIEMIAAFMKELRLSAANIEAIDWLTGTLNNDNANTFLQELPHHSAASPPHTLAS